MNQEYNISLSEYGGEVCLVLYHSPCILNCNWCFNKKNLKNVLLRYDSSIKIIDDNLDYISSVCLTGGEPLLSKDFYRISEYVKDIGLKLKVNTSGIIAPTEDYCADYTNISLKGSYNDYVRYGYGKSENDLINSIDILSNSTFSKEVEWSVVYHPLIIDLNEVQEMMLSLNCSPNYITLNQLQVGECIDSFINDFTPPTREELIKQIQQFKGMAKNHLLIETKEYGREILL